MSRLSFQFVLLAVAWHRAILAAEPDVSEIRTNTQPGRLMVTKGDVTHRVGQGAEQPTSAPRNLNIGHQLHTLENAWAAVTFADSTTLKMWESTRLYLVDPTEQASAFSLFCPKGQIQVNNRGASGHTIQFASPYGDAKPKGTEYLVMVDPVHQRMDVTMFDGQAVLANGRTNVTIRSGEQGTILAGRGIEVRFVLEATNIIQWWIYYPGILDPDELELTADESAQLAASLTAYRSGDLPRALKRYPGYPNPPNPGSDAQRVYYAGLLLSVGAVERAEVQLSQVSAGAPLARALRTMILAVQDPLASSRLAPPSQARLSSSPLSVSPSASELLARSYAHQATNNLKAALESARAAVSVSESRETAPAAVNETKDSVVRKSPTETGQRPLGFGMAWARVAELEFGFGHTRAARAAVRKALESTPNNAQAHALNGFLLAADNRLREAIASFDRAIEIDPGLGNAWLGRGLCKRRLDWTLFGFDLLGQSSAKTGKSGDPKPKGERSLTNSTAPRYSSVDDLATAAALEPTRSLVRSYVGKAFTDLGDGRLARKEFDYAQQLDPNDPTPWLYSALLRREQNEINLGIRDLEESMNRNDNRAVYRSRLLLDQDQAVRGANLAALYRDAGMEEVSVRAAATAATTDYANYSAHLFLADSYNELRDPRQFSLRYETAWLSEYLVANLLAPPGAGSLSPLVTQNEYARLFDGNQLGLYSSTEYWSQGDWRQAAVQQGTLGDFSYAAEVAYQSENGHRPNNDFELLATTIRLKAQMTPRDSLFFLANAYHSEGGDVRPVYDESVTNLNLGLRTTERQEPLLLLGLEHDWGPGAHTLFLGGFVQDTFSQYDPHQFAYLFLTNSVTNISTVLPGVESQRYRTEATTYSGELQQILQWPNLTLVLGARAQAGTFDTHTTNTFVSDPRGAVGISTNLSQHVETDFARGSLYAYDYWQPWEPLTLIAGVSADWLRYPKNFRYSLVSDEEEETSRICPKAGLLWTPHRSTTARFAYSQSLGGVAYDQSYRLEPAQLAGMVQSYRSVIPEAMVGANAAARFDVFGVALDHRLPTGTYVGLGGEWLGSQAGRTIGAYDVYPPNGTNVQFPGETSQQFDFVERSFSVSVHQLLGTEWALGASYRVSMAELMTEFSEIHNLGHPVLGGNWFPTNNGRQSVSGTLHQWNLHALYAHPAGLFGKFEALGRLQPAHEGLAGDYFWQFNIFAGWRFARRRAEVQVGVLNLTDRNYHLDPLNLTADLPRERTFYTSFIVSF